METQTNKQSFDILVVDDEYAIRMLLEKRLAKWGYCVRTANNGRKAISLIEFQKPDLVLTDLYMPEGDGFNCLRP